MSEWIAVYKCRGTQEGIKYLQVFENKAQRDITPEQAASRLRACPEVDYLGGQEAYDSLHNKQQRRLMTAMSRLPIDVLFVIALPCLVHFYIAVNLSKAMAWLDFVRITPLPPSRRMAEEFDPAAHSHRRYNPLTGDWILVSDPHRLKHPWNGQVEPPQSESSPELDPNCFLCPGNQRANGQKNGYYEYTKLFPNDYASVIPPPHPVNRATPHPLLVSEPVVGACDVLVFHPRHDVTLAQLSPEDIARVVDEWINVYKRRGTQESIKYVQIFENKGAMMGCSNPHPHGQIWSLSHIPTIAATELASLKCYAVKADVTSSEAPRGPFGRPCLLCEYIHYELGVSEDQGRVVVRNEHFVALVPWWAVWPFEVFVLPYHRHIPSLAHLTHEEKLSLGNVLSRVTKRYDNLFSCSFAYSMGIHQRPLPPPEEDIQNYDDEENIAHLHFHFFPPLLRSASVRKFLVGFELMGEPQRDFTPEVAAQRLRACSDVHYLQKVD